MKATKHAQKKAIIMRLKIDREREGVMESSLYVPVDDVILVCLSGRDITQSGGSEVISIVCMYISAEIVERRKSKRVGKEKREKDRERLECFLFVYYL